MAEGDTDRIVHRLKAITADLKQYLEKRIELLLLTVGEQYSRWIAESVQRLAGIFLLLGALIFLLVALAIYLGELLDNESLGYVLVSLPLLIAGAMLFYLKPGRLAGNLQQHFEDELVKAITPDKKKDKKPLNLPEAKEEQTS